MTMMIMKEEEGISDITKHHHDDDHHISKTGTRPTSLGKKGTPSATQN